MLIFVHSLGSVWREKRKPNGGESVWNTTGIPHGVQLRSRSRVFGQISLSRRAALELNRHGHIAPGAWYTSDLTERFGMQQLQLIVRVSTDRVPDWYVATVPETLIGVIQGDGWDPKETCLISQSAWKRWQESMFLMRPFGWLKGEHGMATLVPDCGGCAWHVSKWGAAA